MTQQSDLFPELNRRLDQSEAGAGFAKLKADVHAMVFATDAPPDMTALCQVRNVRWPKHDWNIGGTCKRCDAQLPKLAIRPANAQKPA